MGNIRTTDTAFYDDVRSIIISAQSSAIKSVETERKLMYWRLGERIFVEEQRGQDRAAYGEFLIENLAGRKPDRRDIAVCR